MEFLKIHAKEIVSLLVPLITWFFNTTLKPRAQLIRTIHHGFTFLIQQPQIDSNGNQISPTQTVNTGSVLIRNIGKDTSTKVEVVFNWKPLVNIWPSRHYEEKTETDGRYIMIFDSLSPNEHIGFELLAINCELPDLITVRSDQCVAKNIQMVPMRGPVE